MNYIVPVWLLLFNPKTTILFQEPEQPTMNNDPTIGIPSIPTSPRHHKSGSNTQRLTFLTPKLSQTLNYATSGPQMSLAVAAWHLGITSHVPSFSNTISRRSRKGYSKLVKYVGGSSRQNDEGWLQTSRSGILRFKAARLLIFLFYRWHSRHIKKGVHDGFENAA